MVEQAMRTFIIGMGLLVMTATVGLSEPPSGELTRKLTAVVREHCPDATIQVTNGLFEAKYGTMVFNLHRSDKTGEFFPKTYPKEGPNVRGFVLTVCVENGPYHGQAFGAQEGRGPYFPTFIAFPATEDGKNHYWITFSYGSRLDPKLKQAVFAALGYDKFQPRGAANGSQPIPSETNSTSPAAGSRR